VSRASMANCRCQKSLDQMVEALQVFLMTHDVFTPIPIKYNSYVLHLVEGLANAKETIRKIESAYEESKQTLEQNLEQFKQVADEWQECESQYRAEVKRLEVLLVSSLPTLPVNTRLLCS
jgi:hypothetical protein